MRTVKIGTNTIELYSSARELPIKRYHELQKNLLVDSGIGSTMEDVVKHYSNINAFLEHEKIQEAKVEMNNLNMNLYAMMSRYNTKSLSFATLVTKINGVPCNDLTDEGLMATVRLLEQTGITYDKLETELQESKKKSSPN